MTRRVLKWLAAVCGVALLGAAAFGYLRFRRGLRGPDLPVCRAAPLPRRTFGPPTRITTSAGPGRYHMEASAALLPSGTVAIAGMARTGFFDDGGLVVATVSLDGQVQTRPFRGDRTQHYDPWLAVDAKGVLHLAWLGHDSGLPEKRMIVGYATSRDGLAWSAQTVANDVGVDCPGELRGCLDKPMLVADGDRMLGLYFSGPGEGLKLLPLSEQGTPAGPSVVAGMGAAADMKRDAAGRLHLVYVTWDEGKPDRFGDPLIRVEYVRSEDGGKTFSRPMRVSGPGEPVPLYFGIPQVAVDAERGFLYSVYPSGGIGEGWSIILATSRDGGATWTRTRVNDDERCAAHVSPAAALDPTTGALHVVWPENRTGKGGLAYAACEAGGGRCGPNEAVSDAPYASFRLGRHGEDWLGDYQWLLVDAERRQLHAVWTQPVDEGGEALSHLFHARGTLPP